MFLSTFTWAQQPITVETSDAVLHGIRYVNTAGVPNTGPKILFTHGLTSNFHEFSVLMRKLGEAGYDCYAFNFRGHGNGSVRSKVKAYEDGAYSFDRMKDTDFPAMVQFVKNGSRQKLRLIGHSMGGMVPRAAILDGNVSAEEFESFVLFGSPAHFEDHRMIADITGLNYLTELSLNSGSGDEAFDPIHTMASFDLLGTLLMWPVPAYWAVKGFLLPLTLLEAQGAIEMRNFSSEDSPRMAVTADVPKDIFRSFAAFRRQGYRYKDRPIAVPILHVTGSLDQLASAKSIEASARIQSADPGFWMLNLGGVSHVDLIASEVIKHYLGALKDFLESPRALGRPGRVRNIQAGRSCGDLLTSVFPSLL